MTTPATIDGALEQMKHKNLTSKANRTVKIHSIISGGLGVIPLPPLSVAMIIANNLKMLHKLSRTYGVKYRKDIGKEAISSFLVGCGTVSISGRLIWAIGTVAPITAPIVSVVTIPIFATSATYAIGQIFIQHFESGGTFLSFDPEKVRGHYAELFKKGKKLAEREAEVSA
ncbi:MAG TPA: DUF697 domain-containing protein [Hydrogenothermaceae bacterium]|nr:DUF697 domain-containing protein [Hydrogenothermaceae bacterium]